MKNILIIMNEPDVKGQIPRWLERNYPYGAIVSFGDEDVDTSQADVIYFSGKFNNLPKTPTVIIPITACKQTRLQIKKLRKEGFPVSYAYGKVRK